ncbi:hypothetical protein [Paraburkholderia xenovorans]|uniref:hypothetical protein n=1 Tax=Paraburkholderia xenovorans TaxID=36873 RepID=UPI0015C57CFC|nr:hypothetical protein [Paraburkholderia xenovorans]NPT35686.1 hypothetical protein [Paraburkholderia xenovorans]
MNALMREIVEAAKESPKLFFAPLLGAIKAIRREMVHLTGGNRREPGTTSSHSTTDDQR